MKPWLRKRLLRVLLLASILCVMLFSLIGEMIGYQIGGQEFLSWRLRFLADLLADADIIEEQWFYDVGGPCGNAIKLKYRDGTTIGIHDVKPSMFLLSGHIETYCVNGNDIRVSKEGYFDIADRNGTPSFSTNYPGRAGVGPLDEQLFPEPFTVCSISELSCRRDAFREIVNLVPAFPDSHVTTSAVGVVYRVSLSSERTWDDPL